MILFRNSATSRLNACSLLIWKCFRLSAKHFAEDPRQGIELVANACQGPFFGALGTYGPQGALIEKEHGNFRPADNREIANAVTQLPLLRPQRRREAWRMVPPGNPAGERFASVVVT